MLTRGSWIADFVIPQQKVRTSSKINVRTLRQEWRLVLKNWLTAAEAINTRNPASVQQKAAGVQSLTCKSEYRSSAEFVPWCVASLVPPLPSVVTVVFVLYVYTCRFCMKFLFPQLLINTLVTSSVYWQKYISTKLTSREFNTLGDENACGYYSN